MNDLTTSHSSLPAKNVRSQPLDELNRQASAHTFSIDDVPWATPLSNEKNWIAESLVTVRYLPSYKSLTAEQRLRYNHLYALSVCEQFIWFEQGLICPIINKWIANSDLPEDFRLALKFFNEEELRHSSMFRRLLKKADHRAYSTGDFRLYKLKPLHKAFFNSVIRWPQIFLAWIWMAIYFEERTLFISRHYHDDASVDQTFRRCHQLHMIDEARHLQIDQYLLKYFYDSASPFKRRLAGKMFTALLRAYTSPKNTSRNILRQMRLEKCGPQNSLIKLHKDVAQLGHSRQFVEDFFGQGAMKRTRILLSQYPEMKKALSLIE